jgi:seryl-tRNA synthetase
MEKNNKKLLNDYQKEIDNIQKQIDELKEKQEEIQSKANVIKEVMTFDDIIKRCKSLEGKYIKTTDDMLGSVNYMHIKEVKNGIQGNGVKWVTLCQEYYTFDEEDGLAINIIESLKEKHCFSDDYDLEHFQKELDSYEEITESEYKSTLMNVFNGFFERNNLNG